MHWMGWLVGLSALVGGQGPASCERAATNAARERCLGQLLRIEETRLTSIEARGRATLGDSARIAFDAAKHAWSQYVKRECSAVYSYFASGSMASIQFLECHIRLIRDRRLLLSDIWGPEFSADST